ncbi:WD domain-containing protein, partial [Thraustotheca clavata]
IMDPSLQRTFRGHKSGISSLSYGPRLQLVSGAMDCSVMVWNVKPSARAFRFLGHKGPVFDVKWAPSGDVIASGSQDRTVRLWTPSVKGESHVIKGHVGGVRSVDFSYDSTELLTASDDKSIKMWSLPTRRFVCSWNGHSNWVRSARFSPDARLLVSGSDDKTVKLWDKVTRNCISTFYDHSGIINAVRFHPDGTTIGACSFDNTINLWDVRSQKLIQHYPAHEANVTSLDFHPNGHYCLSTSVDGTIKLWDIREGHLLYTMHGHTGAVNCATFSMDGKLTASGAVDALVMVWETDLDKCLHANETNYPAALPKAQILKHVPAVESTPVAPVAHVSAVIPGVTKASPRESAFQNPSLTHNNLIHSSVSHTSTPQRIPLQNDKHDLYNPAAIRYDPVPNNNYQEDVKSNISEKKEPEQRLPDNLASTFDHIVGQLEIITRTLSILEERLCHAEDRIADVARVQTQMLRQGSYRLASPVCNNSSSTHIIVHSQGQQLRRIVQPFGFVYVVASVLLSFVTQSVFGWYMENNLLWPTFIAFGMQSGLVALYNQQLAITKGNQPLDILNPYLVLPEDYTIKIQPVPLSVYTSYPRLVLYSEILDFENAIQGLRELESDEVTFLITQYCWVDFNQKWELAHTRKRQERCKTLYNANSAVYLEAVLRNVNFNQWMELYRGFFTPLIAAPISATEEGQEWITYIGSHTWLSINQEIALWSKYCTYFESAWMNMRQLGLKETIAIENALGVVAYIHLKAITPVNRYSVWTSNTMFGAFENDVGNFYLGVNSSLVLNSPTFFGYTIPDAVEMYNLPYPLNLINSVLHNELGPLGSIDLRLLPLPTSLLNYASLVQQWIAEACQTHEDIIKNLQSLGTIELHPTPTQWQRQGLMFFGGNPMCSFGTPYAFIQESFSFDDTCMVQRQYAIEFNPASVIFALLMVGNSTDLCTEYNLPEVEILLCIDYIVQVMPSLKLFQPLLSNLKGEMMSNVESLQIKVLQIVSDNGNTSLESQYLIESNSSWSCFGWINVYEWALGEREAVRFEGDITTFHLLSSLSKPDIQYANPLDVGQTLATYLYNVCFYLSSGLAMALIVISIIVIRYKTLASPHWFVFNRIASTTWVGRPIIFVRSLAAIFCLSTASISLKSIPTGGSSFVQAPRSIIVSSLLSGDALWLSYFLAEVLFHITGYRTQKFVKFTSAAACFFSVFVDMVWPPQIHATIGRSCTSIKLDQQLICQSGYIQIGHLSRVYLHVGAHLVLVVFGTFVAKVIYKESPQTLLSSVLLHGAVPTYMSTNGLIVSLDQISAAMCGLLVFQWRDRTYVLDMILWRLFEGKSLGIKESIQKGLFAFPPTTVYKHSTFLSFGTRSDESSQRSIPERKGTISQIIKVSMQHRFARATTTIAGLIYVGLSLLANGTYMTTASQRTLANDFYWGYFNSTGGHTFVANLFNQQLLTSSNLSFSLDNPEFGDVRQFYNTTTTTIQIPETIAKRQLFAGRNIMDNVILDLRSLDPCKLPLVFTQYCWLDFARNWELASTPKRQKRCIKSEVHNGAVHLEAFLRNINDWDLWETCWGTSFKFGFLYDINQTSQGQSWWETTKAAYHTSISEEVAYWSKSDISKFTLQWQNYKTLGLTDKFILRNIMNFDYELTLSKLDNSFHWNQQTSLRMYWSFASDLWAISSNLTFICGLSLIRGSQRYAFSNRTCQDLLFQNLTLVNPLSEGFYSVQSLLGPFGNIDMKFVPCPDSLLLWYQSMQSSLMNLTSSDLSSQTAFMKLPQKQYIGQFPAELNLTSIGFEGGNIFCGNDQANNPFFVTIIAASPLFRAYSSSNACHQLVFEFFRPDTFLVLFAMTGFSSTRSLAALELFCTWDYSPGDNCMEVYTQTVAFLQMYASSFSQLSRIAAQAEVDSRSLDIQFIQFIINGTTRSLYHVNILDDKHDISWIYFGWCFLYAWAAGTREVVSFEGDNGNVKAISGPLSIISFQPNSAEIRADLAWVFALAVQYITFVFIVLAAFIAIHSLARLKKIEGKNLFQMNRTIGLVWIGRPFLFLRGLTATVLLHTSSLNLVQNGYATLFQSPRLEWYNLILVSGEVNWLVYILNDVGSILTKDYTGIYANISAMAAWLSMLLWLYISPSSHRAYLTRSCTSVNLDEHLVCTSGVLELGQFSRLPITSAVCLISSVVCFAGAYFFNRGFKVNTPSSILLSAPAKYMLTTKGWSYNNTLYLDKTTVLMAGLISFEWTKTIYILDIKKWRLFVVERQQISSTAPDRFKYAVPMLE